MPPESGKPRALIVEDEAPIRELIRLHLELAGFEIEETPDGREALARTRTRTYDLLMLDLMLPGLDGVSLCRAVRASGPNVETPVLMITARDTESDKVLGLESGADDYLTKPFGIREMMARVGAIMRRSRRPDDRAGREADASKVQARDIILHGGRREAIVRDKPIELTKQEFDLLYQLASRPGMVFSRTALLQHVWSDDSYVTERTVDAVISRLRRKVERDAHDPELILTAWGVGYKFVDD
jgi:DNA-binding response OmpR family regulator